MTQVHPAGASTGPSLAILSPFHILAPIGATENLGGEQQISFQGQHFSPNTAVMLLACTYNPKSLSDCDVSHWIDRPQTDSNGSFSFTMNYRGLIPTWDNGSCDYPALNFCSVLAVQTTFVQCTTTGGSVCGFILPTLLTSSNSASDVFLFSTVLYTQSPLSVTSETYSGTVGTPITLTTSGGSGNIRPFFSVTGAGCSVTGSLLSASIATICLVMATNPADYVGLYPSVSSSWTKFTFLPISLTQSPLSITNATNNGIVYGTVGTPITLTTSGGSGIISPVFTVVGAGCSVTGSSLSASSDTLCQVYATNPANGNYPNSVSSEFAKFVFSTLTQSPLRVNNRTYNESVGTPITLTTSGGSGIISPVFSVTGAGCSVSGSLLSASSYAICQVMATNPANGNYASVSSDWARFTFGVNQSQLSVTSGTYYGTVGTPIIVTTSGGSGVIAPVFSVTGTLCFLTGSLLSATSPTICLVMATNPANGNYASVSSSWVPITFSAKVSKPTSNAPTTTTTTKKPVTTTINCYKGKLLKKVTAVKPVCPSGYKKK